MYKWNDNQTPQMLKKLETNERENVSRERYVNTVCSIIALCLLEEMHLVCVCAYVLLLLTITCTIAMRLNRKE